MDLPKGTYDVDRRFVIWLALSFLLLVWLGPRPERPAEEPDPPAAQDADADPVAEVAAAAAAAEQPARDDPEAAEADQQPAPADGAPLAEEEQLTVERFSLGSLDDESPYRMLVTATNKGAAIERVELASPRYSDLDYEGGYLGNLAAIASPEGGLLVQNVGRGTPAAEAGIEVGDRLLAAEIGGLNEELTSTEVLAELLDRARPGHELKLEINRQGQRQSVVAELQARPLEVIRPEIENVLLWADELPPGTESPPSFLMTLDRIGDVVLPASSEQAELADVRLRDVPWRVVEQTEHSVAFQRRLPKSSLQITKRYRLAQKEPESDAPAYHLELEIEIENLGDGVQQVAYQLDGPNGLPIEGWWYANKVGHVWGSVGLRDVMVRPIEHSIQQFTPSEIAEGDVEMIEGAPIGYLGVDAQYFAAMMIPQKESADQLWFERTELVRLSPPPKPRSSEARYANVTTRMTSRPQEIAPGESLKHAYRVFAGPKKPELLDQYHAAEAPLYTLDALVTYGWFTPIAKLMLGILHFFYAIFGNYGVAIIMLTVLVRGLMFPISRKQALSMMRMQELRPEMERIKEKYKTDMQKQSQAMQELYRKHGVNPLAGCLPMVIQLPVFIGLYRSLAVDMELRQAPLFGENIRWVSNLAAPDMFLNWSPIMPEFINRGEGIFGLGPYLNVLPLVTIGLFLLQQKLFMPEPTNEQAAMQQKIMKYMMVFMGLLFYKVPSGLCLYFIASSSWGIAERKLLPKPDPAAAGPTPAPSAPDRSTVRDAKDRKKNASRNGGGKGAGKNRSKSRRRR